MLNVFARPSISRALVPLGARLARAGVTPDAITIIGTLGAVGGALAFFCNGRFFVGTLVIWFFVMLDMVDGAVARARGVSTRFGAVLDSTADRVADAAVFGSLTWWFAGRGGSRGLVLACLLCLVLGSLTSYVKARAEGIGLTANVGVAERAERLIIALVGTGLDGLGVPYVQAFALWLLVGLSAITVGQRVVVVYRQSAAAGPLPLGPPAASAPPAGPAPSGDVAPPAGVAAGAGSLPVGEPAAPANAAPGGAGPANAAPGGAAPGGSGGVAPVAPTGPARPA
jgi:CDP-diacylglycerol--glycerol-3-phosphate 3-phosphatidyltransferase